MCFRPSAVAGQSGNQIQTGTCPNCGQPVAASVGVEGGTCPHCNKPIPPEPQGAAGTPGLTDNARIF